MNKDKKVGEYYTHLCKPHDCRSFQVIAIREREDGVCDNQIDTIIEYIIEYCNNNELSRFIKGSSFDRDTILINR